MLAAEIIGPTFPLQTGVHPTDSKAVQRNTFYLWMHIRDANDKGILGL